MTVVCVLALFLIAIATYTLRPRGSTAPTTVENLDLFALSARYRPMLRLLDGSDFDLINDAGDPKLLSRIRRQRRAIFRGYLQSLRRDHSRICSQVRAVILRSRTDQKDLASALVRMEMTFQLRMAGINIRLALHAAGIGSVTAEPLMNCFENVRRQAELLSEPATASPTTF